MAFNWNRWLIALFVIGCRVGARLLRPTPPTDPYVTNSVSLRQLVGSKSLLPFPWH
jgi:hypothetical protein